MASLQIIVIMGAIQIRGHTADKIIAVLPFIKFAHFQPRNFGNRIGFIRFLQRPGEKRILRNGLGRHFRINTGASQKKQLFYMKIMAAFNDIALNLHIFIGKFRRRGIVGIDSAHLRSGQDHHIRPFLFKKISYLLLACLLPITFS